MLRNHSSTIRNASTIGAQAFKEVHVTLETLSSGMCWHTVSNTEPFTHLTLSTAAQQHLHDQKHNLETHL